MARGILVAILALWATASVAADDASLLLKKFEGDWVAENEEARTEMRWSEALGGKFMRIEYRINVKNETGETPVFDGTAYYQLAEGESLRAFWADTGGSLHPVSARREGNAMIAHWGRPDEGEQGRSRYELLPSGGVEVTDWVKTGDGWRRFNHNVFTRVSAPD